MWKNLSMLKTIKGYARFCRLLIDGGHAYVDIGGHIWVPRFLKKYDLSNSATPLRSTEK
jgi:hypothetical protein